jgi:hypothetical protein
MRFSWTAGLLALSATLVMAAEPRIVYSKYFKGSSPEFVVITVEKSGHSTYKEARDDEQPLQFQLTEAGAAQIFDLASKLDHFSHALESPAKVANMGMKTFRYEDGPAATEVKFNYTEDPNGRLLGDWFERISETEQDYIGLERTVKFDKLGVNQALIEIEISYDKKRLLAPEQFLPLLDRIIKNESFMHMSRERAARLAELFRTPPSLKSATEK